MSVLAMGIAIGICSLYRIYSIPEHYIEKYRPTPNIGEGTNAVKGIVLHHTASDKLRSSLYTLRLVESQTSSHVLIARDGTRYVLATPEQITWHAGRSSLHGEVNCNAFTIGIEFVGNTEERPLTRKQVASALEYCLPLIKEYSIPLENIVTHEMIRDEWIKSQNDTLCPTKCDIVQSEYVRFMKELRKHLDK